jgi:glycine oxidase
MPARHSVDIAIAGDGLIGLSIAYHLLRRGSSVAVVAGHGSGRASTAAAGMLTPACEYDPWMISQLLDLLNAGQHYYAEFLRGWTTHEQVGYRESEFTLVDLHERIELLQSRMEWLPKLGFTCDWLEPAGVCRLEPSLSPTAFRGGIRIHDQAVVNPIALWEALGAEVARRGAIRLDGGVTGFAEHGDRIVVSVGADASVVADRVVLAAGSWSAEIGRMAGLEVPVCPVKGQMVLLRGPEHLIGSVIYMPSGGCGSIVERAPGQYILGTSEEYLEPVTDNTAGVIGAILSRLCTVIPAAAEWRIERMWSGFRPMTSDELPMIGPAGDGRFIVATGHHRNGVLLTPITGRLVAGMICGDDADAIDLAPFRYDRNLRPYARFASKY